MEKLNSSSVMGFFFFGCLGFFFLFVIFLLELSAGFVRTEFTYPSALTAFAVSPNCSPCRTQGSTTKYLPERCQTSLTRAEQRAREWDFKLACVFKPRTLYLNLF